MKHLDQFYFPVENASIIFFFLFFFDPAVLDSRFCMVLTHMAGNMRLPVRAIDVGRADSYSASGLTLL